MILLIKVMWFTQNEIANFHSGQRTSTHAFHPLVGQVPSNLKWRSWMMFADKCLPHICTCRARQRSFGMQQGERGRGEPPRQRGGIIDGCEISLAGEKEGAWIWSAAGRLKGWYDAMWLKEYSLIGILNEFDAPLWQSVSWRNEITWSRYQLKLFAKLTSWRHSSVARGRICWRWMVGHLIWLYVTIK